MIGVYATLGLALEAHPHDGWGRNDASEWSTPGDVFYMQAVRWDVMEASAPPLSSLAIPFTPSPAIVA